MSPIVRYDVIVFHDGNMMVTKVDEDLVGKDIIHIAILKAISVPFIT
jgi:hypothetical protein